MKKRVCALLAFALLVCIGAGGQTAGAPLTPTKKYSPSPQTLKLLNGLDRPVVIYLFDLEGSFPKSRDVLDMYSAATHWVTVRYVDPNKELMLAKQFGVRTYGTVMVASGDRHVQAPSASEEDVTNALTRILSSQMTACFLQAHGERDLESSERSGYSQFKKALEDNDYQAKTWILFHSADCSLVIVAGPSSDYLPFEVEGMRQYLQGGGRMLFMLDSGIGLPNLANLLSGWNVTLQNDLVVDLNPVAKLFGTEPTLAIITKYGSSPIVQPVARLATAFPLTRSYVIGRGDKAGVHAESLCETVPASFGLADYKPQTGPQQVTYRDGTDYKGPLTVAVSATLTGEGQKPEGRWVALGTSLIAANVFLGFQGNRDLIINAVNWLSGAPVAKGTPGAGGEPSRMEAPPAETQEPLAGPDETSAFKSLRTINTAEVTYSSTYTVGFSRTLGALGGREVNPALGMAGLIDAALATGRKDGYLLTYMPGPVDEQGRTSTYTIVSRPIQWRPGLHSFFTDQSGVIRWTAEDREPSSNDPPVR